MVTPKQPQDRKPKKTQPDEVPECFEFEHDGATYTLKPTVEALTPGFLRRHRNSDQQEVMFTLLESLAEPDVLTVIDEMSLRESRDVFAGFDEHIGDWIGATMGESSAS